METIRPADYVIQIFGGVRATARAVGRSAPSICKWRQSRSRGGTGGNIPNAAQMRILKIAARLNLDITPSDLIWGRRVIRRNKVVGV